MRARQGETSSYAVETTLRGMLGPSVAVSVAAARAPADLNPAEAPAVANAVPRRRHEFAVGRLCARTALRHLTGAEHIIPSGPDRAPVWPAGTTGSLSHCETLCGAVVGRTSDWAGLGLDIERDQPLDENLFARLFSRAEIESCRAAAINPRVIFCAKEAFYKGHYAVYRTFLDFRDVGIALAPASTRAGRFFATIENPRKPGAAAARAVRGAWARGDGFVYAVAELGADVFATREACDDKHAIVGSAKNACISISTPSIS